MVGVFNKLIRTNGIKCHHGKKKNKISKKKKALLCPRHYENDIFLFFPSANTSVKSIKFIPHRTGIINFQHSLPGFDSQIMSGRGVLDQIAYSLFNFSAAFRVCQQPAMASLQQVHHATALTAYNCLARGHGLCTSIGKTLE